MSTDTQLATTQPDALSLLATRFAMDPERLYGTLKNTVFKGASDDEFEALLIVANTYGLNPILKELYAFPAKGGGIVPVVSVDGWISLCNSHPQYDGIEYKFEHLENGEVFSCTAIIHRKDRSHPTTVTEFVSECRRNTDPWKMVHRMIRHKAMIQCARVAFGFSGIHDEDEAAAVPGLASIRDVTPKAARATPLNPFVTPPEAATEQASSVIDAEVVPEPQAPEPPAEEDPMDDPALVDFMGMIQDCDNAEALTKLVQHANAQLEGKKLEIAKQAIAQRAKDLKVKWNKTTGGFTA